MVNHTLKNTALLISTPLIALLIIGYFVLEIVKVQDNQLEEERSHFLNAILENQIEDVSVVAHEFTLWDQAIQKVLIEKDQTFADLNIGSYLLKTYDYCATLVLTPDNKTWMRFDTSAKDSPPIPANLAANEEVLRVADIARKKSPKDTHGSGHWIKIDGQLFLVGASAFTYETSFSAGKTERMDIEKHVLMTFTRADQTHWDTLSKKFSLPYLGFESALETGLVVPINDSQDKQVSHLVIHGHKDVLSTIFKRYGVAVIGIALILIGFALFAIKRSFDLQKAHREVMELNRHMDDLVKERTDDLALALEAAEEANVAKSTFLSSMSHELRTPLNGILGFNQLLAINKDSTLSKKEKGWVEQIRLAGELLLSLVNDVLDMAHVESGRISLQKERLQPATVFQQCYEMTQPLAARHNITLRGTPASQRFITVDARRLQQILLNLLHNAIKYNHPGGEVTFGCKNRGDNHVRLYVCDNGFGIPESEQSKIFEPFFRSEKHHTHTEGTGVGLALVAHLAEAMGGKVSFESVEGQGSTFYVDFPVSEELETVEIATNK
ncbi:sensor histidine kinase [Terasakiella pusilla]|uniref:sensor histidine kinase n=1 Tax=Terasakiella pusilla TaxID=64973 RepID=UPI003AA9C35F